MFKYVVIAIALLYGAAGYQMDWWVDNYSWAGAVLAVFLTAWLATTLFPQEEQGVGAGAALSLAFGLGMWAYLFTDHGTGSVDAGLGTTVFSIIFTFIFAAAVMIAAALLLMTLGRHRYSNLELG